MCGNMSKKIGAMLLWLSRLTKPSKLPHWWEDPTDISILDILGRCGENLATWTNVKKKRSWLSCKFSLQIKKMHYKLKKNELSSTFTHWPTQILHGWHRP